MAWSKQQTVLAHVARNQLGWNEPQYRMILRNVAGIKPVAGKVSSTNPSADSAGFERFMAYAEAQGFVDTKNPAGYWRKCAADQASRLRGRIKIVAAEGRRLELVTAEDFLGGFVEHQTMNRPMADGGPTRSVDELDVVWCIKVLEGLKAWLFKLAQERGKRLDLHGI